MESIRRLLAIHMGPDPPGMSPNNFSGVKYQHGTLPDVRIEVWSGATNKFTPGNSVELKESHFIKQNFYTSLRQNGSIFFF